MSNATGRLGECGVWNGMSIPTFYAGTTFRSRTEARWAVFFDRLNARWYYEYEGFETPDGSRYLPDFWLPTLNMFVEVKPPGHAGPDSIMVAQLDDRKLLLVNGAPGEAIEGWYTNKDFVGGTLLSPYWDGPYCFCFCPLCDRLGCTFDGRGGRVCAKCPTTDKDYTGDDPRILAASFVAKEWRFY